MADIKINDLTAYTNPVNNDVLPIVDIANDLTKKVQIKNLLRTGAGGSATVPSFAFDADPDTGMYRYGTNAMAFTTAGNGRLFINSSGNVGIGLSSPTAPLHIHDSSTATTIRLTNSTSGTSTSDGLIIQESGNHAYIWNKENSFISFGTNNAEKMRIDSSGRLLVGLSSTLNSNSLLQLREDSLGANLELFRSYNSANTPCRIRLSSSRGTAAAPTAVANGDVIGEIRFQGHDGSNYTSYCASIEATIDDNPGANDMPGRLVFSTTANGAASPTQRMIIRSDGFTRVFSNGGVFSAETTAAAGTSNYFFQGVHSRTAIAVGGAASIRIYTNGNIANTNNSYGALSDVKLKENIVNANSQWDDLKALQVRNYNFIDGETRTQIGVVAQEVELVSPGLVTETPDRDDDNNDLGTVTKMVNYSVLYMKAVKALQEAMERIETLEAKVAALEG